MTDLLQVVMTGAMLALGAGWWLYDRRPRGRTPVDEGMDDATLADQFADVSANPWFGHYRRRMVHRALELESHGRALDLGCGPGYLVSDLAAQASGLSVTGIDLSPAMLARAKAHTHLPDNEARTGFSQADAGRIPAPDGSFDLVVSSFSLHHWHDPVAILDEIARVLRPGGSFVIRDLRRDMDAPSWTFMWITRHCLVPAALRRANEPLSSRDASYTPREVAQLAENSRLTGWRIVDDRLWLTLEGTIV